MQGLDEDKLKFDDSLGDWDFDDSDSDLETENADTVDETSELNKNESNSDSVNDSSEIKEMHQNISDDTDIEESDNSEDNEDDGADEDGAFADLTSLGGNEPEEETDDTLELSATNDDFLDDAGNIVVMDTDNLNDGKCFESKDIDITRITLAADRIRNTGSYETIYQSIKSTGLLEPIMVAPTATEGYYVLLHGFRRLQACAKLGFKTIPCTINHRVKTAEIPVLEALYNHNSTYKMREIVKYIDYLEKEKNIMNASLIEYLCQLNNGDYNKLNDIREDDDPDIWGKLIEDQLSIKDAFKALEKRRSKETKEEQAIKTSTKVHEEDGEGNEEIKNIEGTGEKSSTNDQLSDEEVKNLMIDPTTLDDDIEDESLDDMVDEGKNMEGFEPHKQDPKHREIIDPAIRKAVMSRDNYTCQCCKRGGPDYVDILDLHHIVEVYLGGKDSVENSIAVCLNCHKQIHLYAFNQLHIPKSKTTEELSTEVDQQIIAENAKRKEEGLEELTDAEKSAMKEQHIAIYKAEQNKYKRIVKLGNIIRKGLQRKGMKLEDAKKDHPIDKIGRQKPGQKNDIA